MMSGGRGLLLALLFLLLFLLPEAFKILILSFIGGSHYLMMDEISHVLHNRGHEVRMLLQAGVLMIPGFKYERPNTYQITTWSASQDYISDYEKWFADNMEDFLKGREDLSHYLDFMNNLAYQCRVILNESKMLNSLKDEKFDITVIDGFNPCSFLVSEKLGLPFVAVFTGTFANGLRVGIPSPLSYVPVFHSHLTDHMDFWDRVKNCLMSLVSTIVENQVQAIFENVIKDYFPAGSRPVLPELYLKAELWIYNTDFSFEFARPLLPNTVYIGGLLAKPAKPLSQELEDFIAKSGEDGFIIVTFGSMLSSIPLLEVLQEMNTAFAHLPQGVIWRCQHSKWQKELKLASNVKIADWLPQNDLLGHPMARLLVTHGGLNSLMEAIYHGVPVVGIPLFGDQYDNMVRVEARKMGIALRIDQLKADKFTCTMKQVIEDKRYKSAVMFLSTIHHSHPLPPDQRLARWIEHVLQTRGGAHLQPSAFQQPWR
ncbi:UDP-glucuronosyltransferase 3A2-like isoform X2 [Emydura macquarii macquarii]|uniref:UDP-glucuronosyltransferase 3A2-like isoform X2 n=1 Tax=Emydura macquarii macquarii TaxID=1129001 RepID=UPI00352B39D4